jgi:hypothetical protein
LIPVYESEGAGFQRMVNSLDEHRIESQQETMIEPSLVEHWNVNTSETGRIVKWKIAVTEGAKNLDQNTNPYAGRFFSEQLSQARTELMKKGLQLCNKNSYVLLQMQELRRLDSNAPLPIGIDIEHWTILESETGLIQLAMGGGGVCFHNNDVMIQEDNVRIRPSIVIDIK